MLAGFSATQAKPVPSTDLPFFIQPAKQVQAGPLLVQPSEASPISLTVNDPVSGMPFTVYALKSYENVTNIGGGLYVDVYIRFYADNACTIPLSVSGLTVNYMILGYNGSSNYQINNSVTAYGDYILLEYQNEYDYYDEYTQRWRDYHLLAGAYVPVG